jgi:serine/threonine-protein kinase RsbW
MSDADWIWQCERLIPSSPGAGWAVQEEIIDHLRDQQWCGRDRFCVLLALEEAIANAIKHGNRLDPQKHVRVACKLSPTLLRIEIADEGPGFDSAHLPDPTEPWRLDCPCGRGVMLIRKFMSRVAYSPTGNKVILEKDRDGLEGAENAAPNCE